MNGAQCEVPTTADLSRLSLEQALSYAINDYCRPGSSHESYYSNSNDATDIVLKLLEKLSICDSNSDTVSTIESSLRTAQAKKALKQYLVEAWSRNAGENATILIKHNIL